MAKAASANRDAERGPKGAATRARIIEATIQCLVKYGYAHTTTLKVADEAQLSRGAMMYHFENGAALQYAAAQELHERRLRAHVERAKAVDHDQTRTMVRKTWEQFNDANFIAYLELAMAARTDQDLARVLVPLQREYADRWRREAVSLYPDWQSAPELFDFTLTLTQVTLHGLAQSVITYGDDERRTGAILDNLEEQIRIRRVAAKARAAKDKAPS